jgi:peptidoglycan/LPS O-acetylase OafA/YrhL
VVANEVRAPRRLGRVPALDGVRGVAVLLVVWFHFPRVHVFSPSFKPRGGYLGVDAFFVLSGFLITALLLREQTTRGRFRFGAFYRRRALRLFPVIVAFVIAHYVFATSLHLSMAREHSSMYALLLYYTNWKAIWDPPVALAFGHLWSLAVEEQFYLVWPLVTAVLTVRARTRTVVIVLGSVIAFVALRRGIMYEHHVATGRLLGGTDTRADTLLVGALLAHLWVRSWIPPRGVVVAAAWASTAFLAACIALCGPTRAFLYVGGLTVIALAVAAILLAVLDTDWSGTRILEWRPLRAVGRVSYGLYVWHPLVFIWVTFETRHWSRPARFTIVVAATALVTFASWKLVEQPFLRWKDRMEANDRAAAGAAHPGLQV